MVRLLATWLLLTTLLLLATLLLLTATLLLLTATLSVLSIALPSRSVVPRAARAVVASGTVLLSSSGYRTSTGMVSIRVMLAAAFLRVQIFALRTLVALLARVECVRLEHRQWLLLLASLIPLSTTG